MWLKSLQQQDDGPEWPRAVWSNFIGACALAALLAGLFVLARCG